MIVNRKECLRDLAVIKSVAGALNLHKFICYGVFLVYVISPLEKLRRHYKKSITYQR